MEQSTEPTQPIPATPAPPRKKSNRRRRIILYSVLGIFLIFGSYAAYYIYSLYSFAEQIYVPPGDNQPTAPVPTDGSAPSPFAVIEPPEWSGDERINILLLGGDSRGVKGNAKPRSDTMVVVSIDPVEKSTHLFSLLRDTYVKIPDHGSNRLNAAITNGGPLLAMETVHNLIDLPIHFYVYTDFEGFISLIDELGGIDFEVDKDMKRTDNRDDPRYNIKLEKGMQHLDGLTALQYVRYRSDAMSDFARSDRQRKFLSAIADKLQSTTSLLKLPQLLNGVAPYIETNIPPGDMIKLARLGMKLDTSQLTGIQIPQMGAFTEERINDMEVLVPDLEKVKQYVQQQLADGNETL
ncbi:LCP family protein [Cohnella cholangitidis]|uniref:LytR family transcriptional regulator n=1 Tax=Cohnella cholangitidis TaxID=2598458 RepID=A0A7G5C083_9BACL|nr:LCP family protein [Cohnella cholangitidis]QMV42617.1 LytR family transcriptional regulator [Cohnella cholangitidis]